jgi:hypothetical protein
MGSWMSQSTRALSGAKPCYGRYCTNRDRLLQRPEDLHNLSRSIFCTSNPRIAGLRILCRGAHSVFFFGQTMSLVATSTKDAGNCFVLRSLSHMAAGNRCSISLCCCFPSPPAYASDFEGNGIVRVFPQPESGKTPGSYPRIIISITKVSRLLDEGKL